MNGNQKIIYNPFQPDEPVSPKLFVGRKKELATIETALSETARTKTKNILIIGDKGIGKTSIAGYIENLAERVNAEEKYGGQFFTVFCSLGSCTNNEDVCVTILEEIYNKISATLPNIVEKTKTFFRRLEAFGLSIAGFGFSLKRKTDDKGTLPLRFHHIINSFSGSISDDYEGLLIILDELDTISQNKKFAPFLKSYVENLARAKTNVMHLVTASPFAIQGLEAGHDTIIRSFTALELQNISGEETKELIEKALNIGKPLKTYDEDFLRYTNHFASGIPNFVHELGYASFQVDDDNNLDFNDLRAGILGTEEVVGAMTNLEIKYFRKRYTQDILSNKYRRILQGLASFDGDEVRLADLREKLSENDQKGLDSYIKNMVVRGVINHLEGKRGYYSLPDRMFKIFLRLEAV